MSADRAKQPGGWDLDQLADYAAGLLDEARAAELAGVLASDPAAAQLYSALGHADDLVRAELRDLPAISMPADVAARIDAALAAAGPPAVDEVPASDDLPAVAVPSGETLAARAPLTTVGGWERAGSAPSGEKVVPLRRRRWLNGAGAVAAGVAVLAGAAIGLNRLTASQSSSDSSAPTAGAAPRGPKSGTFAGPESQSDKSGGIASRMRASGTNYEQASLATQVGALVRDSGGRRTYSMQPADAPAALRRLAAGGLANCLGLLGIPVDAPSLIVDYARYSGSPAVVVTVSGVGGITVTVAGPDCGQGGTDLKLRTTVPAS